MWWNPFKKSVGKSKAFRQLSWKTKIRSVNDLQSEKLLMQWNSRPTPFVNFTDQKHTTLVGRAREICLNNSYGKGALRILRHNVIGEHGMRMQSHVKLPDGSLDMDVNSAIEEAWKDFSMAMNLDTAGRMNLQKFQEICLSSMVTDGDFFVRIMESDDYEYGVKIQEIDALRIPPASSSRYRLADTEQVYKNGIVFDKATMKPLWYSLNKDQITRYDVDVNSGDRIPATDMLHGFVKERMGQVRGVPLGSTAAQTLYMIGKYIEAALQNARVGASKMGFIEQDPTVAPPVQYKVDENGDPLMDEDGNLIPEDPVDGAEIKLEPGTLNMLQAGQKFSGWSPEYPNNEFEPFVRVLLQSAAIGYSIPYADLSGDLSNVNYSSIRQGALEVRENYKILQDVMIIYLLMPLFKRWLPQAIIRGMIIVNGRPLSISKLNDYCKPVWTPKRWPWIDPQSEAKANRIAVQMGVKAVSQIIKETGGDPEEVWETTAQDIKTMKAKGIPETIISGIYAQKPPTAEEILAEIGEIMGMEATDATT